MDIGGRPMFSGDYGDSYGLVYATQNPPTGDSWGEYIWPSDHAALGFKGTLCNRGGFPAVMLERFTTPSTYYNQYAYASSLTPGQDIDWTYHDLPDKPSIAGNLAGIPVYLSSTATDNIYMARSATPATTADWMLVNADPNFYWENIVNHAGLPAFLTHGSGPVHLSDVVYTYPTH
jgi:hypothetical protein